MNTTQTFWVLGAVVMALLMPRIIRRLQLSRAKHRSLAGHGRISRRLARLVPGYDYDEHELFRSDGAPEAIENRRRAGFERLTKQLAESAPESIRCSEALAPYVSDVQFTNAYRIPFQYRRFVAEHLKIGSFAKASSGVKIQNLDGNWSYDLGGSYGVNLLGYDFYKDIIDRGIERVRDLGPVLGPYHPIIQENVELISQISGLDEVSFHMSGTEAVMQAVRLARFHTRKPRLVMFCGAYHGWWDGVQPGVGNPRPVKDVFVLEELGQRTLNVLRTRNDIACVLINPLQALSPNASASSDAMLVGSDRRARFDRERYARWLKNLRAVCDEKNIVLIFDEVFMGFRLGLGGAQAFFDVKADMVTYGKTIGGGLPIGVCCGTAALMKRYRDDKPTDICFARGTFNSHPYIMASMNEFLRYAMTPDFKAAADNTAALWDQRAQSLNATLEELELPVRVRNMSSVFTVTYTLASRFNWMLQYYLRAQGLALSWVGTGRFIFSHNYTDDHFSAVADRFLRATQAMHADGWWWQHAKLTNKTIKRQVLKEMLSRRFAAGK